MILHTLLDYDTLRFIWWLLLGILLIGFAVMDGFDLGVATQELLAQNRMVICKRLLSVSMAPREVLDQLVQEMRSYMVYVDPPKTLFAKPRRTFTGKMGGHNDDVVISLQLAVLTMQIFTRSAKYERFL